MLVSGDAFHDGKGAHERVVTAVKPPGRAFERRAKAHDPMGANLPPVVLGLVEVDDEAAECFVDGHFKYKRREWLDSQSQ